MPSDVSSLSALHSHAQRPFSYAVVQFTALFNSCIRFHPLFRRLCEWMTWKWVGVHVALLCSVLIVGLCGRVILLPLAYDTHRYYHTPRASESLRRWVLNRQRANKNERASLL